MNGTFRAYIEAEPRKGSQDGKARDGTARDGQPGWQNARKAMTRKVKARKAESQEGNMTRKVNQDAESQEGKTRKVSQGRRRARSPKKQEA